MNAYKPIKPGQMDTFPKKIEGLSPSIWEGMYTKETNQYHGVTDPCMLCDRIRKIMKDIDKCHKNTITKGCDSCTSKTRYIPYLDRGLLSNLHAKHLELLTKGEIGGRVIQSRTPARAWLDPQNTNRQGEPLETQIKRELAKFSKLTKKDKKDSQTKEAPKNLKKDKEDYQTQTREAPKNLNEKEAVTKIGQITPRAEPPAQLPTQTLTQPDLTPTEPCAESLEPVDNQPSHPLPDAPLPLEATAPPLSPSGFDEAVAWMDDDEPWAHNFYLGSGYPKTYNQDGH